MNKFKSLGATSIEVCNKLAEMASILAGVNKTQWVKVGGTWFKNNSGDDPVADNK